MCVCVGAFMLNDEKKHLNKENTGKKTMDRTKENRNKNGQKISEKSD